MVAGNIADLSMAVQTTKGTPAVPGASTMSRVYLSGGGLAPVKETADLEETTSQRLRTALHVKQARVEGSPEFYARPDFLGWLLWGAMGGKATSGASDPYTHTFTLGATQPYMTLWRMLGAAKFERFADCKIKALKFHSEAGMPLKVTADIVGLSPVHQTAAEATATVEVANTFLHADAKGAFLFETVAVTRIESFDLTMDFGATLQQGDDWKGDQITEGLIAISIETREAIVDFATWNRMIFGATSPSNNAGPSPNAEMLAASGIDFTFSKRDTAGAPVTPARSLQFTATNLAIAGVSGIEANTNGDPIKATVSYKVYQPSSGSGLTAILKNSKSAYAAS